MPIQADSAFGKQRPLHFSVEGVRMKFAASTRFLTSDNDAWGGSPLPVCVLACAQAGDAQAGDLGVLARGAIWVGLQMPTQRKGRPPGGCPLRVENGSLCRNNASGQGCPSYSSMVGFAFSPHLPYSPAPLPPCPPVIPASEARPESVLIGGSDRNTAWRSASDNSVNDLFSCFGQV